jgi:hypothetical protein
MLGFHLDFWDYATFLSLAVLVVSGAIFLVWLAGLPGRIAIARKHPDAEAVNMMGWAGFLAAVPWIQAFIWAFKPTDIVDIRRFPPEERVAIDEMIARLRGVAPPGEAKAPGVQYREAMREATEGKPPPEGGEK